MASGTPDGQPKRLDTLLLVATACLATAVLLPDAPWRGPLSYFDVPSLVGLGVGALALSIIGLPKLDVPARVLLALVFVGIVVDLLRTVPLSTTPFARGPVRTLFYLGALLIASATCKRFGARKVLSVCAAAATVEALVGLGMFALQYEGPFRTGVFFSRYEASLEYWLRAPRLAGTFNYEGGAGMNGLAAYLVLHIPVTFGLAWTSTRRASLWWVATAAQLVALVLTYTRAGLLALMLGCGAAILASGPRARRFAFASVPLVATLALIPAVQARFLQAGTDRKALFAAGASISAELPFLGHGDIDYVRVLFSRADYMNTASGPATATPHNALIMAGFRYGVIGVLLALLLLLWPIKKMLSARYSEGEAGVWASCGLVVFVGFLTQAMTNSLLDIPNVTLFYAMLLGVLPIAVEPDHVQRT